MINTLKEWVPVPLAAVGGYTGIELINLSKLTVVLQFAGQTLISVLTIVYISIKIAKLLKK